ncbi:MAG: serine/threonine-protein phosphatase [Nocardioidaceae bacterium]|nr:serine/threonine-protein phosphatase [Nocardioidaceae bacterium]
MTALRCTAFTDVGPNRKNNQDSGYASRRLLVLADGMGGQAAGDLASSVVVQTVRRLDTEQTGDVLEALAGATHRANDRLSELVDQDPSLEGMGTTLIAMVFEAADGGPDRLSIAHVGDSRAYLWRAGELTQLTTDHTFVQSLVDEGRITEAEARTHPHRSLILKALQGGHSVDPDLFTLDVRPGDRVLLCSDGLSDYVEPAAISRALGDGSIELAATELIRLALDAPTTDNVTCVIGEVVATEDAADEAGPGEEPLLVGSAAEQPRPPIGRATGGGSTASVVELDGDDDYADDDLDLEELRYAPLSHRRNRFVLPLLAVLILLAAAGLGLNWAYDWSQSKYFVADSDGVVAIFQGIPQDIPGIEMSKLHEATDLPLDDLPEYRQEQVVDGIEAADLEGAERTIDRLWALAEDCNAGGKASQECSDSGPQATAPSSGTPSSDTPSSDTRSSDTPSTTADRSSGGRGGGAG